MVSKLERMRAKLKRENNGGGGGGDSAVFPFWNTPVGESATLRYLPDKDESNDFFWKERQELRWSFMDPNKPGNKLTIRMSCIEMWDGPKSCPVVNELRGLYKIANNNENTDEFQIAKALWPKKSYIYQGFVRRSVVQEQSPPENPIRVFMINKMIHKKIKDSVLSDDPELAFDVSPDDLEKGTDFIIKVTQQGRYNSYNDSTWSPKRGTSLTDHELAAIEKYGLFDLSSRLPQRASEEAYAIQMEMLEAWIEGFDGNGGSSAVWDPAWDKYWKPWDPDRNNQNGDSENRKTVGGTLGKQVNLDDEPEPEENTGEDETPAAETKPKSALERARERARQEAMADEPEPDEEGTGVVKDTKSLIAKLKKRNA